MTRSVHSHRHNALTIPLTVLLHCSITNILTQNIRRIFVEKARIAKIKYTPVEVLVSQKKNSFSYHQILTCHNRPSKSFHSSQGRSNTPRLLWSVQSPEFLYRKRPDEQNPDLVYLWSVQSPESLYRRRPDEQNPNLVYLHRKKNNHLKRGEDQIKKQKTPQSSYSINSSFRVIVR